MEYLQDTPLLMFRQNTLQEVRNDLNLNHDTIKKMLDTFEDWISKQNHFTTRKFMRSIMEYLQDTPLLMFRQNTLQEVRNDLNLNHDTIKKMLDTFEDWISKQNHFTTRKFSLHYLETSLIYAKGSLERAKTVLDKLCTLKTLLPNFFSKHDVKNELLDTSGFMIQATMPQLLKDNYRVYVIKAVSADFDSAKLLDFHRFCILMSEYVKMHDYSLGFVTILDCRDVNILNFVTKINIVDLRHSMSVLMEGYGLRVKGIHLLSSSKTVDTLVTLLKQVVSQKVAGRIHVHKNVESLHEFVEKDVLPKEYGGNQKPLKEVYENWVNVLSDPQTVEFFREISQAKTDEKYRLTANYNDQILGMPGSFRTLAVD